MADNTKKNKTRIFTDIQKNIDYIKKCFSNCFDLIIREISLFNYRDKMAIVVYIEDLVEKKLIEDNLISKLTCNINSEAANKNYADLLKYNLGISDLKVHENFEDSIEAVLSGNPIVFLPDLASSFEVNLKNLPNRSISEPPTEVSTRGPREGFTESIMTNIALIRKKIRNCNLKVEKFKIGEKTNTDVSMLYLSGEANETIVNTLRKKLKRIKIESMLESNYIAEYIYDQPKTIYPVMFKTEKPDVACAKILEGRIVIIVDGSPVVLSIPGLFVEFLQSSEDYYIKYSSATLNRFIRYLALMITVELPALYVALTTFHQELIPSKLLLSIIEARANVPFPEFWEVFFMLLAFELMREAGIRVSKTLGPTISVVGALVLGDSAVRAGIVGTPTVVIVSLTAITKFVVPAFELEHPIIYMRFFLLTLAGCLGLFGLICGILILTMRLVSIKSFGVPYMFPICPFNINSMEDVVIRAPMEGLKNTRRILDLKRNLNRKNR
ncbi:spore germination protein [Clostridium tyrobutyricum]|uniref:spore germination protein n=2 Tax=Clostridium tyrobutyricum TaxID=1519 RepID=UPI001C380345|nr:spore germination protein [Clostridium tyrobutyricum]MBV4449220.1 spore germination protein [Clostridium tyrobutyricum]